MGNSNASLQFAADGIGSKTVRPDGITKISDSVYLLSEPASLVEVEIVFIHGPVLYNLMSREAYWKTWITDEKDKDGKEVCWPMAWLGEEFPEARIWSLSYDLSALTTNTTGRMAHIGESLVQEMVEFADIGQINCPVVFVCHSLGGLVAKEIVIKAHRKFGNGPKYKNFLQNIGGFFFYATPHNGSKLADLAPYFSMTSMAEQLRVIDANLGRLNAEFEHIERDYFYKKWQFSVVAETHNTALFGFSALVVEEASARFVYNRFLAVSADHFRVCKPKTKMGTSYLALTDFIISVVMAEKPLPQISPTEKWELDLMEQYNVSRAELYDNREIAIFRVGDREYLEGTVLDKDVLQESLLKTKGSILEILSSMEELVKEVKIWCNQCQHLLEKYCEGVDRIVDALNVLTTTSEVPPIGLNPPLLQFICSKLICSMLEGEALLLFCSGKDNYSKAAFALSSPRLSKLTFSRFALVLHELNWTVNVTCYVAQLYVAQLHVDRDELFDDWKWCKKRRKLVYQGKLAYQGNLGPGVMEDESLEADGHRQTQDREALLEFLNSKPTNPPSSNRSSLFSHEPLWMGCWIGLWTWLRTWVWTSDMGVHNQHQLETIWKKRLQATSHILGVGSIGDNGVSKGDSIPTCFWIDKPEFKEVNYLGHGGYKVFKVCKWLGETMAVSVGNNIPRKLFETEVGLLSRVQHPNIVELIGCAYDASTSILVTELMEQDLGALICQQKNLCSEVCSGTSFGGPPFDLPVAVDILLQIVEGMIHSHQCGVIHRDLKPQNFLASPKYQKDRQKGGHDVPIYYTIKLIDFGEAKMGDPNCFFHTYMRGTSVYRAPEVYRREEDIDGAHYSWPADVYSFGMTCYEVITGKAPFTEKEWTPLEVKRFILGNNRPLFPFRIPSLLKNLIERCWAQNPDDRPTFEEIRKDLWQCKVYYAWTSNEAA